MRLSEHWKMIYEGQEYECGSLPVSCLKTLQRAGVAPDFYIGENQYAAEELSRRDCIFVKELGEIPAEKKWIVFHGVDTLAKVYLNDVLLGSCDNMHRVWAFPIPKEALGSKNCLKVHIQNPMEFAEQAFKKRPLYGVASTVPGYQHIRKAHYMYGWDWGAVIPDMGIFREVELREDAFELECDVHQSFNRDYTSVRVEITPRLRSLATGACVADCGSRAGSDGKAEPDCSQNVANAGVTVTLDGQSQKTMPGQQVCFEIQQPELWFPNGYGEPALYELTLETACGRKKTQQIGLREIKLSREEQPDGGREFCFVVNGIRIFTRGANFIPQDNLLPDITREKTETLLKDMQDANYTMVRVWGGGFYPHDYFYDICDRLGLMVWQDFMFACAAYDFDEEQLAGVYREACDNIWRLKNHASLALWCGNNEMESMWEYWGVPEDEAARMCYRRLFGSEETKGIIPEAIRDCHSDTTYWPSSPSTGGGVYPGSKCFVNSSTTTHGDSHFWDVWHSFKPIEEFRRHVHRFCSEFGFESMPDYKSVRFLAQEENPNVCDTVMEAHQKCELGNEKLMFYMAQMAKIPPTMRGMVYASQLVQAECIRIDVEHLRRHRGISMGALFWQVNDCWPVTSWASIDYFGNKKGLHYASKRFFAPLLVSCDTSDVAAVSFHVSSELRSAWSGTLVVRLREKTGEALWEKSCPFTAELLAAKELAVADCSQEIKTRKERRSRFLELQVLDLEGNTVYHTTELFVRPKEFAFEDVAVMCEVTETADAFCLTYSADGYVHAAALSHEQLILDYSDNWFELVPGQVKKVTVPKTARNLMGEIVPLTQEELGKIQVIHCGNYMLV